MGVSLSLGPIDESPGYNPRHGGRAFFDEIIVADYPDYFKQKAFLSEEEITELQPEYDDGAKVYFSGRDPAVMKSVFQKVFDYLRDHHSEFPLTHWIYTTAEKSSGRTSSEPFEYKGDLCYLEGDHKDQSHRNEIQLCRRTNCGETLEWIIAAPEIMLNSHKFFILPQNRFELFKDNLEELIHICDRAILIDKKLVWKFSN